MTSNESDYVPKKGDILSCEGHTKGVLVFSDFLKYLDKSDRADYKLVGLSLERIVERDDKLMYKLDTEIQAVIDADAYIHRKDVWKIILNAFERDTEGNLTPNRDGNTECLWSKDLAAEKQTKRDEKLIDAIVFWITHSHIDLMPRKDVVVELKMVFVEVDKIDSEEKKLPKRKVSKTCINGFTNHNFSSGDCCRCRLSEAEYDEEFSDVYTEAMCSNEESSLIGKKREKKEVDK